MQTYSGAAPFKNLKTPIKSPTKLGQNATFRRH